MLKVTETPKISIVVPVWNEATRVQRCLRSIKQQTETSFEVIIVDDGSIDDSERVILNYIKEPYMIDGQIFEDNRFKYLKKEHSGIGNTLNVGFSHCRAKLLTWISADSWVNPDFLEKLKAALDENPDKILAYSDWRYFDEEMAIDNLMVVPEYNRKALQIKCDLGPCWMFRAAAKHQVGEYCEGICEDYYMHLMLSGVGDFIKVPEVLGYWTNHNNNTTNRVSVPTKWVANSLAKAKARWQQAKYRVAYLCPNLDAASVGWFLMNCVNDLSDDFSVRHVLGDETHLTVGVDTKLYTEEAKQILRECDIVHCNNQFPDFNPDFLWLMKDKKFVIHMHAGQHQWDSKRIKTWQERGSNVFTCTPGHKHAKWIPNFMPVTNGLNITYEQYYTPAKQHNDKLQLICHHNYEAGKGLLQLRDVILAISEVFFQKRLKEKMEWSLGGNVKMPILDHLILKKHIDVCFDTMTHGYCGMATWESMAQSNAVICKMDEITQSVYKDFFGSVPPIMNPRTVDDVAEFILALLDDRSLSHEMGEANRQWILDNYTADRILELYERIYVDAIHERVQSR